MAALMRYALLSFAVATLTQSQPTSPTPRDQAARNQAIASDNKSTAEAISSAIDKLTAEVASWKKQADSVPKKKETPADWWLKWGTIISAIATVAIAVVGILQWRTLQEHRAAFETLATHMGSGLAETKKAADAARDSADAAKQSFVMSHRPKFAIRYMDTPKISEVPISGTFRLYNSGDTSAALSRMYFSVITGHLPRLNPHEDKHGRTLVDIVLRPGDHVGLGFPTEQVTLTSDETFTLYSKIANHQDIVRKGIPNPNGIEVYVVGWLEYLDEAKTKRRVGFCQKFDFTTERFIRHPDPDYEYGDHG